nr:MAG TPA: hypothetical protein [Crassvirales sp.]
MYSTLYYPILLIQCIKPLNTLLTSLIFLSRIDVNLLMLKGLKSIIEQVKHFYCLHNT